MYMLSNILTSTFQNIKPSTSTVANNLVCVRNASKKASSSTRIKPGHPRPKHRGWRVQDGEYVQAGTILATQLRPRFHPGYCVGLGKNLTLFAMEAGKVMVTCEKIKPNWKHAYVLMNYGGREGQTIYKKHFNVIPDPQHDRFVVIDRI